MKMRPHTELLLFLCTFVAFYVAMVWGLRGGWVLSMPNILFVLWSGLVGYAISRLLSLLPVAISRFSRFAVTMLLAATLFNFYVAAVASV